MSDSPGYNQRLFGGGFRKWLHEARFLWVRRICHSMNLNSESVLELGCFDARTIKYFPTKPNRYYGFDANWEGGLDLAREAYGSEAQYQFVTATRPEQLEIAGKMVSLALSLETMEHISPELVGGYLRRISGLLDGVFIVTVPNEKGLLFLAKYLVKKLVVGGADEYTIAEVLNATLGRMERVARAEHKGFDWEKLLIELKKYFDVEKVEGIQFPWAPLCCNAQIGFVLRSRKNGDGATGVPR